MKRVRIKRALRDLGETPDEIAQALTDKDCQGVRGHHAKCPLAVYLRRVVPDATVSMFEISHKGLFGYPRRVETPREVRRFVYRFDDGAYPELDINSLGYLASAS